MNKFSYMKKLIKTEQGYSAVEMLAATGITVLVLAGVLGAFNDAIGLTEKSAQMNDMEQNLRTGINLMVRDYLGAGWEIPKTGISIPNGENSDAVARPGPVDADLSFTSTTIPAISPGNSLATGIDNLHPTDIVNLLYADNGTPFYEMTISSMGTNGESATVTDTITGVANPIRPGDLIEFINYKGNTLQYVTRVVGQTMYFDTDDRDLLNLNQPDADAGSITELKESGSFPSSTIARRIWLITYYLDFQNNTNEPRLMRQINAGNPEPVALILDDMQLSYDIQNGDAYQVNVVSPATPNQIRKVNIFLSGRSAARLRDTNNFLRRSLTTQASIRSLSFRDRYQ
jgi:hypothetical protein